MPGGQGRSGTDRLTADESWRSSHMQQEIYDAIDDYQFQHQHGISRAVYQRQQQIAEQQHLAQETQQRRIERQEVQQEGCWTTFLIYAGLFGLVVLLGNLANC